MLSYVMAQYIEVHYTMHNRIRFYSETLMLNNIKVNIKVNHYMKYI